MKELTEKLQAAEGRAGEYLDDLKRLKAEFDNYRKRMIREQTSIIELANQGLVSKLLPVIDNLERAIASAEAGAPEGLTEGVQMVRDQLVDVLEGEGLEEVNPHGHPFDPHVCEAVNDRADRRPRGRDGGGGAPEGLQVEGPAPAPGHGHGEQVLERGRQGIINDRG